MMRHGEPFKTGDGTCLNVDTSGEGTPVVFQHGLCGDAGQTSEAFPLGNGFRRVTVEARGHGRSEPGDLARLSIATFTDDLALYIMNHLTAPVVVGGISMGAAIALRLAVTHPDLVKALILARPAWVINAAPANMAPNAEVGRLLKTMPAEKAKATFLAGETSQRLALEAPDNLASLSGFFTRQPHDVTAALLTAISDDGPGVRQADLGNLRVPTLVIGHEEDVVHPLAHAQALASMIHGARLAQITPKTVSRTQYIADFHLAIGNFLKEL
ncbi:pimeloyl-ACP methyl ester carboxylesterase [Rhizobium skierniewicense]|uniref:Pimeloyl-ACP methyl ester carboxylesterase n=2 Tax=Rhizobium skierniewicense TaxID=984260 RepID=A0A7W6G1E0_9HYPH|nr:pimeloyl-ACP methyl ester carboxylesterase [Rhizobium skierniewicense]